MVYGIVFLPTLAMANHHLKWVNQLFLWAICFCYVRNYQNVYPIFPLMKIHADWYVTVCPRNAESRAPWGFLGMLASISSRFELSDRKPSIFGVPKWQGCNVLVVNIQQSCLLGRVHHDWEKPGMFINVPHCPHAHLVPFSDPKGIIMPSKFAGRHPNLLACGVFFPIFANLRSPKNNNYPAAINRGNEKSTISRWFSH